MPHAVALLLALVVMAVGVIGTLIPALPGMPLVWLGMLGYGWADGFRHITWPFLLVALAVVVLAQVAEHYARAYGAKRFGAGRAGAWGAVIGSIAGLFFMPIGLLVGPFLGAMVAELLAGRPAHEAVRAGWGGLVGALGSVAVNFVLALSLVAGFIIKLIL